MSGYTNKNLLKTLVWDKTGLKGGVDISGKGQWVTVINIQHVRETKATISVLGLPYDITKDLGTPITALQATAKDCFADFVKRLHI